MTANGDRDSEGWLIACHVKAARREHGKSVQQLAADSGCSRKTIGRIEAGKGASSASRRAIETALRLEPGILGRAHLEPARNPRLLAFGKLVRAIRRGRRLTLSSVAADLEVSSSALSRLERGLAAPRHLLAGGGRHGESYFLRREAWRLIYFKDHLERLEDILHGEDQLTGEVNRW